MSEKKQRNRYFLRLFQISISAAVIFTAALLSAWMIGRILYAEPELSQHIPSETDAAIMDSLDHHLEIKLMEAEQAAKDVHKYFWIEEYAESCPVPDQDRYGQAQSAAQLQWLLDDASALLDGQSTLFNTEIQVLEGSSIDYFLDDSILAITWKQVYADIVFTISEVKVAHASQFRRYIADDTYDSRNHYYSTDMAAMNNAVVAASADFYRNRPYGTLVYEGQVFRMEPPYVMDICFVDRDGNLNFTRRKELTTVEQVEEYVAEHDINFSITFGPVLVDDGVQCNPPSYSMGEIHDGYPRAALCQYDDLHYIVLTATAEAGYSSFISVHQLADVVGSFGCQKAYTLDGGQTANLVMNNRLINNLNYPNLRAMSDIIYFATAVPNNK